MPEDKGNDDTLLEPFKEHHFRSLRPCLPTVVRFRSKQVRLTRDLFVDFLLLCASCDLSPSMLQISILPTFEPNEYLWETHSDKGRNKAEIYAWAIRDLIAKVGGFGKRDVHFARK